MHVVAKEDTSTLCHHGGVERSKLPVGWFKSGLAEHNESVVIVLNDKLVRNPTVCKRSHLLVESRLKFDFSVEQT